MKIQFRSIIGQLVPEERYNNCTCCCFDFSERRCIPYFGVARTGTIFEKTETDIFEI